MEIKPNDVVVTIPTGWRQVGRSLYHQVQLGKCVTVSRSGTLYIEHDDKNEKRIAVYTPNRVAIQGERLCVPASPALLSAIEGLRSWRKSSKALDNLTPPDHLAEALHTAIEEASNAK